MRVQRSDAEHGHLTREQVKQRARILRERRQADGLRQLLVWIHGALFDEVSAARIGDETMDKVVSRLLRAGLAAQQTPSPALVATIDTNSAPAIPEPADFAAMDADFDRVIADLAKQGMKQSAIAAELNKRGFRTSTGKPFTKGHRKIMAAVKAASAVQR